MPMVPVSYVLAAVLVMVLMREMNRGDAQDRNGFLLAFLGLLIVQLVLVGTRFGFGQHWILAVQPLTASMLGPLAYLSFAKPTAVPPEQRLALCIHLAPLVCAVLTAWLARSLIDISQGFFLLLYTGLLVQLGVKGQDAIGWAELDRTTNVYRSLWFVTAVLALSGITDWLVAFDFWSTGGENTANIAGKATLTALISFSVAIVVVRLIHNAQRQRARTHSATDVESAAAEQQLISRITKLLDVDQLHFDPDLSLLKLARKLAVPQRQVSEAINRQLGMSVSQFINNRRIEAVCEQLVSSDLSITQIMMNTGFNTKSNFNREFRRKMGMSPSAWRRAST